MARKRHEEEHENHERWLVSYADFITLLFAFFVVMYAISSVNEGKYRVLSDSMVQAFRAATNVQGATMVTQPIPSAPVMPVAIAKPQAPKPSPEQEAKREQFRQKMRNMAEEVKRVLAPLVKGGQVRITEGPNGISIEINASALFSPGEAQLGGEATRALRAVAEVISQGDFPIKVEGHTDGIPISNSAFPSNWELSAVRASSVIRLFIASGVAPGRLTAAGYADQRPVADNASPDGRARNRRVTIMVESMMPDTGAAPAVASDVPAPTTGAPVPMTPLNVKSADGALGTPENLRLVPRNSASAAN